MRAEELLAAALRGDAAPWPLDADDAFAAAILEVAREHGVAALLPSAPAISRWPDGLQRAFRDVRRDEAVIEPIRRQALQRVLAALQQAGIRCLVIKGAELAYTHYSQPWLRPRVDTDLLIAPADRDVADAALRAIGYLPTPQVSGTLVTHQLQYQRRDRYQLTDIIDLHWKVTNPHLFADVLTFDELMTTARPIPQVGEAAWGPSTVHALLLACVHRVAHHQNSELLIWLYDIHVLVAAMTPGEHAQFLECARVKRLRSICRAGLDGAGRRFRTPYSPDWRDRLETSSDNEIEPSAAFLQPGVRRIDILLSDLRAVGGWTRRMRLLREHLLPPAEYVRARYGHRTPLLFAYVDRVVTGVGKWFRAAS